MIELFRNRQFTLLWLALIVAQLGEVFYKVGVMVTVFERTGSALQTTGVFVANTLPTFLLGPIAGAWVDRYPHRLVLLIANLVRGVLVGLLLLVVREDSFHLWGIYLVLGGLAAVQAVHQPARLAIIPRLVRREQLVQANSLVFSTTQASFAASYVVGGLLVTQLGLLTLVGLNVACFLLAVVFVWAIQPASGSATAETTAVAPLTSLLQSIREGLSYLRQHQLARPLVTMELLEHIPHALWISSLMLAFVQKALNGTAADWGYQSAAYYSGTLLGALLAVGLAHRLAPHLSWLIIGNAFLFGLLTIAYAFSPTVWAAAVLAFAFGPSFAIRDVAQDSLLQTAVSPLVLGRIYAMRSTLAHLTWLLAGISFAWLADQMPVRWLYVLGGVLYLATAVYALAKLPRHKVIHYES